MHVCLRAVWHAPLALGSITPFTSGLTPNALSRPKDGDVLAVLACAATTRYLHSGSGASCYATGTFGFLQRNSFLLQRGSSLSCWWNAPGGALVLLAGEW